MSSSDEPQEAHSSSPPEESDTSVTAKKATPVPLLQLNHQSIHSQSISHGNGSGNVTFRSSGSTTPTGDPDPLVFKLLCPQSITGLIIGRGGSIINHLNSSCGARVKLSQNNEFYPGTTDRILILYGSKEGIANAIRELVTRIADAPDKQPGPGSPTVDAHGNTVTAVNRTCAGAFQMKVLIPKHSSAMLIGKGGAVIKHMTEISNCRFQMGEEADPYNTKERVVVLSANAVPNLVGGTQTIMAQLLEDPRVRSYVSVSTNYGAPSSPSTSSSSSPPLPMQHPLHLQPSQPSHHHVLPHGHHQLPQQHQHPHQQQMQLHQQQLHHQYQQQQQQMQQQHLHQQQMHMQQIHMQQMHQQYQQQQHQQLQHQQHLQQQQQQQEQYHQQSQQHQQPAQPQPGQQVQQRGQQSQQSQSQSQGQSQSQTQTKRRPPQRQQVRPPAHAMHSSPLGSPMIAPEPHMFASLGPQPMMAPSPYGAPVAMMPPGAFAMGPYGMIPAGIHMAPMHQHLPPGAVPVLPQYLMHQPYPMGMAVPGGVPMPVAVGGQVPGTGPGRAAAPVMYSPYGYPAPHLP